MVNTFKMQCTGRVISLCTIISKNAVLDKVKRVKPEPSFELKVENSAQATFKKKFSPFNFRSSRCRINYHRKKIIYRP